MEFNAEAHLEVCKMYAMTQEQQEYIIGYSALSKKSHTYLLIDDAVYIADSFTDMENYIEDQLLDKTDYLIDTVCVKDLINDYGDSNGLYALEVDATEKFRKTADKISLSYELKPYESYDSEEPELYLIEL